MQHKIIIISPAHPLRGGIAASAERLAYELQNNGNEVIIYSFSLQYPSFLFPGKTQYTEAPTPSGLTIATCINAVNPFNWLIVARKIAVESPDIIITRYWLPFMGPCLGTILRCVRWWHKSPNSTRRIALVDNILPHEKRLGDRFFSRYFTAANDEFVVMSKSVANDLRQFTTTKPIRYSPHPVYDNYGDPIDKSLARSHLGLDLTGKYILFFGFIRAYKGLDLLLEAMADEAMSNSEVQLIVAGEFYEQRERYDDMIQVLGLQARVHLHADYIADEKVRDYFCATDLVVQPYKTATQSGISQIAYHFEKPMVVTNVGGLPEIVIHGETGYVVEVQPKAIAQAIVHFFETADNQPFKQELQVKKKLYSWKHLADTLLIT